MDFFAQLVHFYDHRSHINIKFNWEQSTNMNYSQLNWKTSPARPKPNTERAASALHVSKIGRKSEFSRVSSEIRPLQGYLWSHEYSTCVRPLSCRPIVIRWGRQCPVVVTITHPRTDAVIVVMVIIARCTHENSWWQHLTMCARLNRKKKCFRNNILVHTSNIIFAISLNLF